MPDILPTRHNVGRQNVMTLDGVQYHRQTVLNWILEMTCYTCQQLSSLELIRPTIF